MPSTLGKAFTLGVGARKAEAEAPAHAAKANGPETGEHQDVEGGSHRLPPPPTYEGSDDDDDDHGYRGPDPTSWRQAFFINFMGNASPRYKQFVLLSLVINPFLLLLPAGKKIAGWFVLVEFLATLAASLQAYPLQAGGLLLVEANIMGITNPYTLLHEVEVNLNVLLMLIFMVAAIHFLKNMLLWIFTNLLIKIENKIVLSLTFMLSSAVMSAFLDALTVTAVIISVCTGFLGVYYYVEKNSFLPLLNNKRHNEMAYELVPQPNPEKIVTFSESEVNKILANPDLLTPGKSVTFCEEEGDGAKGKRSLEGRRSLEVGLSPDARRSLDMVRRGSAEMVRTKRGSWEGVPRAAQADDARSSLELVRQKSNERKKSKESKHNKSTGRSNAREAAQQDSAAENGWRAGSGKKGLDASFDDIEAAAAAEQAMEQEKEKEQECDKEKETEAGGGGEANPLSSRRKLSRSNSQTDLEEGPRSNLAEDALQPDGHFAVPNLKQVLSQRIVQPRLPAEVGDERETDLDLRHLEHDVNQFKAFLRSIVMHAAVGTTVGGIFTMVGEPQNLIVAKRMQWDFSGFVYQMLPVSLTVLPCAILVLIVCEKTGRFGYGAQMPEEVRWVLADFAEKEFGRMKLLDKAKLMVQVFGALLLVVALVMHFAEVGFIGLMIVVVLTAFNGITVEHEIAHAFLESMPFVSLLVVFLGVVGMIHDQHLFEPIIQYVLGLEDKTQLGVLYLVNGALSAVSDNVFVATVFVEELEKAFVLPDGTFKDPVHGKLQYDRLGTAIIAGTNLPSMFTPNGQAALLFILTSSIAPLIHLSYRKMMVMTLPYVIVCSSLGCLAVVYWQWGMI